MKALFSRVACLGFVIVSLFGSAGNAQAAVVPHQAAAPVTSLNWADHACTPLALALGAVSVVIALGVTAGR